MPDELSGNGSVPEESTLNGLPYDNPAQIAENFRRWTSAMEVSHAMLMAGLRDRVGPDGDAEQAYRQWQAHHRTEKLRAYERAAERYRRWREKNSHFGEASGAS
jgi:hypothetical protein